MKKIFILIILLYFSINIFADSTDDALEYYKKGYDAIDQNKLDDALKFLEKSIDYDKNGINGRVFNEIGYIFFLKKDYDKALLHYNKSLEIDMNYISALRNRANIYIIKEDYLKAYQDLNQVIKIKPDFQLIYYQLGNISEELKNIEDAIKYYEYFIKLTENIKEYKELRNEAIKILKKLKK